MPENGQSDPLQSVVACYLSTLVTVANCLAETCPDIGAPYRQRLSRMRARLAFHGTPEAIQASCEDLEAELKDYAVMAAHYAAQQDAELRRCIEGLEEIVRLLAQRQDFYGSRLRQFALQMEATPYPTDPDHLAEVVALQAAGLRSCIESISHESESIVLRMHDELAALEQRLDETKVTDPSTGLMNRREMERQIAAHRSSGKTFSLLKFELAGEQGSGLSDRAAKQVAERLGRQFRHRDLICRWSPGQFLVLFQGPAEIAQSRVAQILPWIEGRYTPESGPVVQVTVEVKQVEPEAASA